MTEADKSVAPDLVGGNTFGDDLEDNIPLVPSRRAVSYTHETTVYPNPTKRLEEIENTYRLVPSDHELSVEVTFRHKSPSEFYKNSRFIIWRDRSVTPIVFYWERKRNDDPPSTYKYGPFKELGSVFEAIKDIFGLTSDTIERLT